MYYNSSLEVSMEELYDPMVNRTFLYPGKPIHNNDNNNRQSVLKIHGTGVWNSYFYPVSDFDPHSSSRTCGVPPIMTTMSEEQIIPKLHIFAPYAVRAWRYGGVPPILQLSSNTTTNSQSIEEWLQPMRQKGHTLVAKYYKPLPHIRQLVQQTLIHPQSSLHD